MTQPYAFANQSAQDSDTRPRVSVVMTVYNDLRFFDAAVDSVLAQDFGDLELVVVDDGTGQTELFDSVARRDPRIRLVINPTNIGTAAAANRGIEASRADIIVRLDADDISEPARIGRLVAALDEDPELGLVGSAVTLIVEDGRPLVVRPMPLTDVDVRWTILFQCPFYHSTVAFRRSCYEAAGRYRPEELVSQDHYLWFEMLPHCRMRNLAEPLTRYRINSQGLTATNAVRPRNRTHRIREALWPRIGLTYDLYDDALALDISNFLNGGDIAKERRAAAYARMLTVLKAYLKAEQPFARPADAEDRRRLGKIVVSRMLRNPPGGIRSKLALYAQCLPLAPGRTVEAAAKRLVRPFRRRRP